MNAEQRFHAIQKRYADASARREAHGDALRRRYGLTSPPAAWVTRGEQEKADRIVAAQSREEDKMFALLDDISPRRWRSGVAVWWIMECLTYLDACTSGPLSECPVPGYGTPLAEVARFSEALS